ncbi:MAG: hypothetical protein KA369_19665 [Spirochaetes bacterium]|nr:hypothetical protein [Spirochaetota bacterium]
MNTKLTLNIDKNIINKAKTYASNQRISLSKLVEEYLKSLSSGSKEEFVVAPITKELSGIIKKKTKIDYKSTVEDYLITKHIK